MAGESMCFLIQEFYSIWQWGLKPREEVSSESLHCFKEYRIVTLLLTVEVITLVHKAMKH
jgi:hypothetical protein